MTIPAFLQNAEEEDAADLARLTGVDLNAPLSDGQLDAFASDICRHLMSAKADRARYEEAQTAEQLRITTFYEARFQPIDLRIKQLETIGEEIAKRAQFPGKSKSRKVAFGSYGSRKVPEKVSVVDDAKAIEWAQRTAPTLLKTRHSIVMKDAKPVILSLIAATGEVPPGFEHTGESEMFFIKAEEA